MTPTPKPDGRHRPRFKPPQKKGKRPVTVYLDPADYRSLYEMALEANTSLQEVMRGLIRAAAAYANLFREDSTVDVSQQEARNA